MRHRKKTSVLKLGRTASHRLAMLRNMTTSLFEHERIKTTDRKAKALRSFAENLITVAKRGDLHSRRRVLRDIKNKDIVTKLFDDICPRYTERHGGYTRIIKVGNRHGDNASMSIIELSEISESAIKSKEKETKAENK